MPDVSAKILVADDSELERQNARNALESEGYEVIEAPDGQAALELFIKEGPDLVMLDVVMPRLTGLETCRIIKAKAQGNYLPVIMLSSRNSVNARVEGLRSGADDYLGKPYDSEELKARVEALLRTKMLLQRDSRPGETRTSLLLEEVLDESEGQDEDASTKLLRRTRSEFDRARRYDAPLAVVRVAVDPSCVEGAGREALESLDAQLRLVIENCVRKIDLVFRRSHPGEVGFTVLLPNTHFPGALAVGERLCIEGAQMTRADEPTKKVSVSVGVAYYKNEGGRSNQNKEVAESAKDLLRFVELALEKARDAGGAHICLYQHRGYLYAPSDAP